MILLLYIMGIVIVTVALLITSFRKDYTDKRETTIVSIVTGIIWPVFFIWMLVNIIKEKINDYRK